MNFSSFLTATRFFSPFWNSASTTEKNYIVKSQPWKWNLFHQMLQVYVLYVKFKLLLPSFVFQLAHFWFDYRQVVGKKCSPVEATQSHHCQGRRNKCIFGRLLYGVVCIHSAHTIEQFRNRLQLRNVFHFDTFSVFFRLVDDKNVFSFTFFCLFDLKPEYY